MRLDFDLRQTRAQGAATLLPPGEYDVTIRNAEIKVINSTGEQFLNLWYQVDGPSHIGETVFEPLHLWATSEKRVEISLAHLKGIRQALGLNAETAGDTDELINKRMKIRVAIREYNGNQYQDFKSYKPNTAQAAQAAVNATQAPFTQAPQAQQQAPAASPAGNQPYPW